MVILKFCGNNNNSKRPSQSVPEPIHLCRECAPVIDSVPLSSHPGPCHPPFTLDSDLLKAGDKVRLNDSTELRSSSLQFSDTSIRTNLKAGIRMSSRVFLSIIPQLNPKSHSKP